MVVATSFSTRRADGQPNHAQVCAPVQRQRMATFGEIVLGGIRVVAFSHLEHGATPTNGQIGYVDSADKTAVVKLALLREKYHSRLEENGAVTGRRSEHKRRSSRSISDEPGGERVCMDTGAV